MQLELKCGTVWQITSLPLCLSHFSPADSNNIMFHWLSLLCHFTCLSLFHHFLSCLSVTDTLSLSPYHYPLSSFPTVIPISPFSPFYWQLSHGISDATVSTRLSSPSFSKTYVLFPSPPLTLSYWQLSWSIDVVKYSFFFVWRLCLFWFYSLWLGPTAGSAIQCDESQKEHIESFFILYSALFFPSSSSSSSQGLTVIPCLYMNVCVHVKCSSSPLSVMHVDKVWGERWHKDMSLHASMSFSLLSPICFAPCFITGSISNSATK